MLVDLASKFSLPNFSALRNTYLSFIHPILGFKEESFSKTFLGKKGNAGTQSVYLFQMCFLSYRRQLLNYLSHVVTSKLKSLQITISILMKMAESSPNGVENIVEKREIARYEQFLLFLQCSLKTFTADPYKPRLDLERVQRR